MAGTSASAKVPECVQDVLPPEFTYRILNIPIVKGSFELVKSLYTTIKDSNFVTKFVLDYAEEIVKYADSPLLIIFGKPLQKLDILLCSIMDYVNDHIKFLSRYISGTRDLLSEVYSTGPVQILHDIREKQSTESKYKIIREAYRRDLPFIFSSDLYLRRLLCTETKGASRDCEPSTESPSVEKSLEKNTQEPQPEQKESLRQLLLPKQT